MMRKEIGKRLTELRESRGLPRLKVAEDIGYDQSNLSKVEKGTYTASPELLKTLAEYYNVSVAYLYGEEQEVPEELKEIGVEWISFAKEMEQENITPERIKRYIEVIKNLQKDL
ncbi:helix-turn-helix domain-containing protein [Priestia aryabhattai]|uniref:helix-turn-helix domain-containing protein n=1 Tax=Priestia aryabhattai TaxID=412384 RepID=UPI0035ABED4A